ncbi:hypothetical protein [Rhizobium lentis]|uniref:hypothetical protein n=1 Tax=Rhizobium lentis TaxID=1138194 RepID=UPI00287F5F8F|nr:hypothetical protein [Rhizobium lentis]
MGLFAFLRAGNRSLSYQLLHNRLLLKERRVLLTGGKGQDRGEVPAQHDVQLLAVGNELDPIHEGPQHLCRPAARLLIAELVMKGRDLLMVILGEVRVKEGRRLVSFIENVGQFLLSCFELAATLLEHLHWHRVLEIQLEDLLMLTLDAFQFRLSGVD